jgi:hypothetical protein
VRQQSAQHDLLVVAAQDILAVWLVAVTAPCGVPGWHWQHLWTTFEHEQLQLVVGITVVLECSV